MNDVMPMPEGPKDALDHHVLGLIRRARGITLAVITTSIQLDYNETLRAVRAAYPNVAGDERLIDKSLQRLRKRGLIYYFSPPVGWKIKERP